MLLASKGVPVQVSHWCFGKVGHAATDFGDIESANLVLVSWTH